MEIFKPREYKSFVDQNYQKEIYNKLTDINFPWHFMEDATFERANTPDTSTPCFANLLYHTNYEKNPEYDFFIPLIDRLKETTQAQNFNLLRVRIGFLLNTKYSLPSQPYRYNTPHRDYDQDHYVAVYYVNETDGDTVVFRETELSEKFYPLHKCTPEAGKLLLFNGWHYHSSTCPKIHTKRIAITINFQAKIDE